MTEDDRNPVQQAYDESVGVDGYPTARAQILLLSHPGLVEDCANTVQGMDDFDPRDAFLAGFTAALIWREDNVATGEPHDTEKPT